MRTLNCPLHSATLQIFYEESFHCLAAGQTVAYVTNTLHYSKLSGTNYSLHVTVKVGYVKQN